MNGHIIDSNLAVLHYLVAENSKLLYHDEGIPVHSTDHINTFKNK